MLLLDARTGSDALFTLYGRRDICQFCPAFEWSFCNEGWLVHEGLYRRLTSLSRVELSTLVVDLRGTGDTFFRRSHGTKLFMVQETENDTRKTFRRLCDSDEHVCIAHRPKTRIVIPLFLIITVCRKGRSRLYTYALYTVTFVKAHVLTFKR